MRRGLIAPRVAPGGHWPYDWSAYSSQYDWSFAAHAVAEVTWHTIVDQAGAGVLTFVRAGAVQMADAESPNIRLTVNGVARTFLSTTNHTTHGNLLFSWVPFETGLKIEIYNKAAVARDLYCVYTYLLRTGVPDQLKNTLLDAASRNMAYELAPGAVWSDVVDVVAAGWLLGLEFKAHWDSGLTAANLRLTVDGVVKVAGVAVDAIDGYPGYGTLIGPVRFATRLKCEVMCSTGDDGLGRCWYLRDV